MSLDKKLKDIQEEIGCCSYHMESKEFRDRIKQVFIDEGYVKQSRHERTNQRIREEVVSGKLISGQTFYDKFIGYIPPNIVSVPRNTIFEAAKKASGIK